MSLVTDQLALGRRYQFADPKIDPNRSLGRLERLGRHVSVEDRDSPTAAFPSHRERLGGAAHTAFRATETHRTNPLQLNATDAAMFVGDPPARPVGILHGVPPRDALEPRESRFFAGSASPVKGLECPIQPVECAARRTHPECEHRMIPTRQRRELFKAGH